MLLNAISSKQPILNPCLFSIDATKFAVSLKFSIEPVSSQAPPLPIISAVNLLFFLYLLNRSTISNSFLFDGLKDLQKFTTLLSKKYKPVTARLEFVLLGFSMIFVILFFLLIVAIPYNEGFLTG